MDGQAIPRDAVPSVDDPDFGPAEDDPDDEVPVLEAATGARAYPIRILNCHGIVNDVVGGEPVAVRLTDQTRSTRPELTSSLGHQSGA